MHTTAQNLRYPWNLVAIALLCMAPFGCSDACDDYLDACVACGNSEADCQASIDAVNGDEDACRAAVEDIEAVSCQ